ncbi:hypothetical protein MASR1M66_24730 [Aminivibrio sp.]
MWNLLSFDYEEGSSMTLFRKAKRISVFGSDSSMVIEKGASKENQREFDVCSRMRVRIAYVERVASPLRESGVRVFLIYLKKEADL